MASEMMQAIRSMVESMEGNDYYATENFEAMRAEVDQMSQMQVTAEGVSFEAVELGGVPCEIAATEAPKDGVVVMYLHGGAFITGNCLDSRGYISDVADVTGFRTVSVEYRCAPENPFPAAPDDCFAAYTALLECYPGWKIAVVGDSAGATLALDIALMARRAGMQMPLLLGLYSPVTEMGELPSHMANAEVDTGVDAQLFEYLQRFYYLDADPADELLSPLRASMEGMPPLQITVDVEEILLDDSLELATKAAHAGVPVKLSVFEGCIHAFPASGKLTPESCGLLDELAALIALYNEED